MLYLFITTVSKKEKVPLTDADIKGHVRNVSKAHCQRLNIIISTNGKPKRDKEEKGVDRILDENETDLFNTFQMIKEWLEKQECSNYEKRIKLQNAVDEAKKASTSNGKACEEDGGEVEEI